MSTATKKLTASTKTLITRIKSVDFPERFEGVEDKIENLRSQTESLGEKIEETQSIVQRDLEKTEDRLAEQMERLELLLKVAIASPVVVGLILLLAVALM